MARTIVVAVSVLVFLLTSNPLVYAACMLVAYAAISGPATDSRKKVAR